MKKIILSLSVVSIALAAASCVDNNYDLDKLNTEVTLGENLTIPVAETAPITFSDLIEQSKDSDTEFEKLPDGTYKAFMRGDISFSPVQLCEFIHTIDFSKFFGYDTGSGSSSEKLNMVLAFERPYLLLDLFTNVGRDIDLNAKLVPYKGGKVIGENIISVESRCPKASSYDTPSSLKLFISEDGSLCPEGYSFICTDMGDLLKSKIDSISLVLSAEVEDEQTRGEELFINASYEIGTPLSFSEDFVISYRDTLDVSGWGSYLKYADASVFGSVENKLPLQFEFEVTFLDDKNDEIHLLNSTNTLISSCNPDGSVKISDYEYLLRLEEREKAENIKKVVISFKVTSGSAAGVGIKSDSYIKASIKLRLPDGMTYDLNDLIKQ